ncbi:MAG: hypothetical protein R2716_05970 [Microthrixaceae bacterium]
MDRNSLRSRALLTAAAVALAGLGAACVPPSPGGGTTTTVPSSTTSTTTSTTEPTTTTTSTTSTTTSTTTTTSTIDDHHHDDHDDPPGPTYQPIALTCRTPNPLGSAAISDLDTGVTIDAPSSVAQGGTFQVEMTADPIDVPTHRRLQHQLPARLRVRFDLPAGTAFGRDQ